MSFFRKDMADYAKSGQHPPTRSDNQRLGDISYQLSKINESLIKLINKLT